MTTHFTSLTPEAGRELLRGLFAQALDAVDPLQAVPRHLPPRPRGRTVVVGAGKAAARMALALERAWDGPLSGLVVTRYGHGEPCERIEVVEAGHPVPDEAGLQAAQRIRALVTGLGPDDLVVALISGGGSSLLTAPADGVSLADKRALTTSLLRSGADIHEMNCVRKHLSTLKGGRLAQAAGAAAVWTLVVSDVPGDDPRTVASGPTLPDDSTAADALDILARYGITPPPSIRRVLVSPPAPAVGSAAGPRECRVIATAQSALEAAAQAARSQGLNALILGNAIEGEARQVGRVHAGMARQVAGFAQPLAAPAVLLSGGETTVTVSGNGRGGRNAEFLLGEVIGLAGHARIWGLAADTDGIDGSQSNAGAVFGPDSWQRGLAAGLSAPQFLARNDAYSWFEALGDLVVTGPTRTNVNDFRATLIV
ncbi:glycerate kinase type-2 family protein [Ramlibacter rhizophilus]|uniref:Glycerate kinase n=1 Tax=Ramlibacter rhizophilus TaxID=1781167 RepID=A0A4Z0BNE7_9BURK|nr:glycerate kinase [Ramlibacter rhizophilus]TFY99949.1 glycerate kinase [Ramlibacter rhizophilus]